MKNSTLQSKNPSYICFMSTTTQTRFLNQDQALSLIDSIVKQSEAEGVFVSISGRESALSRFGENQISQNVSKNQFQITITSYFDQSSASASTTDLNPDSISATIKRSQDLARFAPKDPEWIPLLEPQIYDDRTPAFDEYTATISPLAKGEIIKQVCHQAKNHGVEGSGTLSTNVVMRALGNSCGLKAYDTGTMADFSFTARIENGSSWNNRSAWSIQDLPIEAITEKVIQRGKDSRNPQEIQPGVYPVIFDAAAMSDLLSFVIWNMNARSADEGRSFMSADEGGNKVGEKLFSPLVQVQRNPAHPLLQFNRFNGEGLSNSYLDLIKDGIPLTLNYSRYWAKQQNKAPTGGFYPIVMTGSNQTISDLIAQTEKGILISRAWYVRYVNPKTLEVTGMTRDGTFWIENGKIAYPIKNMRFNQSLPDMLRDVEAVSQVQRFGDLVVPGVKVKAFNFSSITDSI